MMLMSNSFKTIEQICADDTPPINQVLKNADWYWAHIPKKHEKNKEAESLEEHINLVLEKFRKAVVAYGLDSVIDRLIEDYALANFDQDNLILVGNYIKKLFVHVIAFHDHGKVNVNFQALPEKMNNPRFQERPSELQYFHSALGAYIYIAKYFQEVYSLSQIDEDDQETMAYTVATFSYAIFKHHSSFLGRKEKEDLSFFSQKEAAEMQKYLALYNYQVNQGVALHVNDLIQQLLTYIRSKTQQPFPLTTLVRLSFSLLTASDYMASGEYMLDLKLDNFQLLTQKRVNELYQTVSQDKYFPNSEALNYNRFAYEALKDYQLQNPKDRSNKNLNILRKEMAVEVLRNIRAKAHKNLFYIEAPTGGGKTNLSILAMVELLKANPELNRVYYVFPFTTLITQTFQSIIQTLGLSPNEVVALHSKAGFKQKTTNKEEADAQYGAEKINFVDNLFVNYPFCLLSHIKFFDVLKGNKKSTNYLLHRLANSVVIIDELQSYNPNHWDKVIHLIQQFAHYFNIKFILMSATLPKLDKLNISQLQSTESPFTYLLPNAKRDYFQNPNFNKRVSFDLTLTKQTKIDLELLADQVLQKSEAYSIYDFGEAKPKGSVYTIVEFIFKKTATKFKQLVDTVHNNFFNEIFVLSGTILPHRRQHIINFLKNSQNRKKRILLITTQVVEAGVDIDMDIGFKDQSLIDSDEQLAGRINRNVNKRNCVLYLFQHNKEDILYSNDPRLEITRKRITPQKRQEILSKKDFDRLYDLVLEGINAWNQKEGAQNLDTYLDYYQQQNFRAIHQEFKLIEQENISIFVPMHIPLYVAGKKGDTPSPVFSKTEYQFLETAGIINHNAQEVDGSKVFDVYIDLVHNRLPDYITHEIRIQVLQGIMSKFVFSVFKTEKTEQQFNAFSDLEKGKKEEEESKSNWGFLYLSHWEKIYDEKEGIDDSKFDHVDNQFL